MGSRLAVPSRDVAPAFHPLIACLLGDLAGELRDAVLHAAAVRAGGLPPDLALVAAGRAVFEIHAGGSVEVFSAVGDRSGGAVLGALSAARRRLRTSFVRGLEGRSRERRAGRERARDPALTRGWRAPGLWLVATSSGPHETGALLSLAEEVRARERGWAERLPVAGVLLFPPQEGVQEAPRESELRALRWLEEALERGLLDAVFVVPGSARAAAGAGEETACGVVHDVAQLIVAGTLEPCAGALRDGERGAGPDRGATGASAPPGLTVVAASHVSPRESRTGEELERAFIEALSSRLTTPVEAAPLGIDAGGMTELARELAASQRAGDWKSLDELAGCVDRWLEGRGSGGLQPPATWRAVLAGLKDRARELASRAGGFLPARRRERPSAVQAQGGRHLAGVCPSLLAPWVLGLAAAAIALVLAAAAGMAGPLAAGGVAAIAGFLLGLAIARRLRPREETASPSVIEPPQRAAEPRPWEFRLLARALADLDAAIGRWQECVGARLGMPATTAAGGGRAALVAAVRDEVEGLLARSLRSFFTDAAGGVVTVERAAEDFAGRAAHRARGLRPNGGEWERLRLALDDCRFVARELGALVEKAAPRWSAGGRAETVVRIVPADLAPLAGRLDLVAPAEGELTTLRLLRGISVRDLRHRPRE